MQKYVSKEIIVFLQAVDQNMISTFELVVIGGTAAALAYQVNEFTKDIDTVNRVDQIQEACEKAREQTGLYIPLGPVGVEQAPYHYDDRLEELSIDGLSKLKIFVPEKHDLALMKATRANANDLDTIDQIHKKHTLDYNILVERYKSEMSHIIGNKKMLRLNFLGTIERVFGSKILSEIEKTV